MVRPDKNVYVFKDIEELTNFALKKWKEISKRAIAERGRFTIALAGGETSIRLYQKLSELREEEVWHKTYLFFGDERFVPLDDKDSNYRMAAENLINRIDIPKANVFPVRYEATPEESAKMYQDDIAGFFNVEKNEFPVFDLMLLGMGEDGHTASLFPGHCALNEKKRIAISVSYNKVKNKRVSLSLPVINNAGNTIFLVAGSSKAKAVKEILEEENRELPVSLLLPKMKNLFFLLDQEAAAFLLMNKKKP